MGIWSALSGNDNPKYNPKPLKATKAAKIARRGGSAISATSAAGRPARGGKVRGGSR